MLESIMAKLVWCLKILSHGFVWVNIDNAGRMLARVVCKIISTLIRGKGDEKIRPRLAKLRTVYPIILAHDVRQSQKRASLVNRVARIEKGLAMPCWKRELEPALDFGNLHTRMMPNMIVSHDWVV